MNRKEEEEEKERLSKACWLGKWEVAKALITKNPFLLCTTRENVFGYTPAYRAVCNCDIEMLLYMADAILLCFLHQQQEPREEEKIQRKLSQMLRDVFEKGDFNGYTPAHQAAWCGRVQCFAFLMEHAPSGEAVLEVKNPDGRTPVHIAAGCSGVVDTLDFIVRHAPNGMGMLEAKTNSGRTPLDWAFDKPWVVDYCTAVQNRMLPTLSSSSDSQGRIDGLPDFP